MEPIGPNVTDPVPVIEPDDLFARLAQQREEQAQNRETFIPIAGYNDPTLLIKYQLLSGDDLQRIGRRVAKTTKDPWYRQLYTAMDVMIESSTGLFVDLGDGQPKPLTLNGEPVTTFSNELAEKLRIDVGESASARRVLQALFMDNDVKIGDHFFKLQRWMGDTSVDVDTDIFSGL